MIRLIPFCVLCSYSLASAEVPLSKDLNVKTVIFSELDITRHCWDADRMILLRARMIMQSLVPNKIPKDMDLLIEYVESAEEAVRRHTPDGNVRVMMMKALADVMGGFLQSVAIPVAKENYYAGNVEYAVLLQLHDKLGDIKALLRTDGGGWARPVDTNIFPVTVSKLEVPPGYSDMACKALYVACEDDGGLNTPRIAIPYLDYDESPGAVALPLRSRDLYSINTAAASQILIRFYILATQCLGEMSPLHSDVFNRDFLVWLKLKVMPHLRDDEWYPGFGGVMRIVKTINRTELLEHYSHYLSNDPTPVGGGFVEKVQSLVTQYVDSEWWYLLLAVAVLPFPCLWCCSCYCFLWYWTRGRSSSGILRTALSLYCGLEDESEKNEATDSKHPDGYQSLRRPSSYTDLESGNTPSSRYADDESSSSSQ